MPRISGNRSRSYVIRIKQIARSCANGELINRPIVNGKHLASLDRYVRRYFSSRSPCDCPRQAESLVQVPMLKKRSRLW
ncbi:unnamed protein product [Nezara viridula]|uniref:Uncharacterized protein n=1 Tax=Nezara viridula TaxID=85310 RepID=A0A9P0HMP2_NEZVI|nr:unnamed protein product [Nezara viridula]